MTFYQEECGSLKLNSDYNIAYNVKNVVCGVDGDYTTSGSHDICQNPQLAGPLAGVEYGMMPLPGSPAIDSGDNSVCPPDDYPGSPRPAGGICNRGAYE